MRRPATLGVVTQPPIVPGPGEPYEQQQPGIAAAIPGRALPAPTGAVPPQPVYQVGASRADLVGKTAISTVVVIVTLVMIFCVLPAGLCLFIGGLGSLMSPTP